MYILNSLWQEIFEAFSKGGNFIQTFGITIGIIAFLVFLLRPILTVINNAKSQKYSPTISDGDRISGAKNKAIATESEFMKFCDWLVPVQNSIGNKNPKKIQKYCSIEYFVNERCIVYLSNTQLKEEHYKVIFTNFDFNKASLGIILRKPSLSDESEINKAFKSIKEEYADKVLLPEKGTYCYDYKTFNPIQLIQFMGVGNDWLFKEIQLFSSQDLTGKNSNE